MKILSLIIAMVFLASCSKSDIIENESIDSDAVKFTARSKTGQQGNFRGHLSGEATNATGQVIFNFAPDNSFVHYKLLVAGVRDVISADLYHSHMDHDHAVLNLSGNVIGSVNGILSEGFLTDEDITCSCNDMSHHTLANIRQHIEDGETYVKLQTVNGDGNIEGAIH